MIKQEIILDSRENSVYIPSGKDGVGSMGGNVAFLCNIYLKYLHVIGDQ